MMLLQVENTIMKMDWRGKRMWW